MKAILIARVSTEEQKEADHSLPAQVARLEKYCLNKGYVIHQVCSFELISLYYKMYINKNNNTISTGYF